MKEEDLVNDIKILKNINKIGGSIGIYRKVSLYKQICEKYKKYPGFSNIADEIKDIDLIKKEGLDKLSKLDEYYKNIIDCITTIKDYEDAKKTLMSCINTCKKYHNAIPDEFLTNENIKKSFKKQKQLFNNRLKASEELLLKLYTNSMEMKKFCAEVNNIKKAIIGTAKEMKSYGFDFKKVGNIKEEYFEY